MKQKAIYYHAGCPVCVDAERNVVDALDRAKYDVESVNLGLDKQRVAAAASSGVKSVPALVLNGTPFHINFGASLSDLK
jgi:glutaredoxin